MNSFDCGVGRAFLLETEYSTESGSMDETDSANQGHIRDNYSLLTLNRHRKLCSVGLKGSGTWFSVRESGRIGGGGDCMWYVLDVRKRRRPLPLSLELGSEIVTGALHAWASSPPPAFARAALYQVQRAWFKFDASPLQMRQPGKFRLSPGR
ncbi:hypothetical protein An15g03440 [Aspergillus niger]|uniref:Uncharacterized protein n=2 Tax=Aspergillus niger TaxID=5061 RepID=A2R5C4_ASPNC|nr:hypothetical protein An15g03440 [Aspergillus niger]CAK42419.1 hypothetical protein An15g03440 [Aspergillus niger]